MGQVVYPHAALDTHGIIYLGYRNEATGEGRMSIVTNGQFADPVTFTPAITDPNTSEQRRWNCQLAPALGGGVYVTWDYNGQCYIRPVGVNATPPPVSVSIDMGSPDVPNGIVNLQNADGNTTPVTIGGRSCRQNVNPNTDLYFYFGVSDLFAFQGNVTNLYVVMDYFDTGSGTLGMQYDSTTGNTLDAFYKSAGSVALTGSNTWKEHVFHITDAYFGNRQNAGADFRISIAGSGFFYLDVVQVIIPQPPPLLHAGYSGHSVAISWPTNAPGFFVLQASSSLTPAGWTDVTNSVNVIGSQYTVTDSPTNTKRFFRLRQL